MPIAHAASTGTFNTSVAAGGTLSVSLTTAVGDTIIVTVSTYVGAGGHPTFTCTDNKSNGTPSSEFRTTAGLGEATTEQFKYENLANAGAGHQFTISPSIATEMQLIVTRITTGAPTGSSDTSGNGTGGTTGQPASGSITTTNANDLLVSAGVDFLNTTNFTPGAGFTVQYEVDNTDGITMAVATRNVTATGSYSHTWGGGSGGGWQATIIAVKEDPGLGPTINTQPASQTSAEGQPATFTIVATTTGGTLHYQWKRNGVNVGTDSSSYTTPAAILSDNDSPVYCAVTDDNGTRNSDIVRWYVTAHANTDYSQFPKQLLSDRAKGLS